MSESLNGALVFLINTLFDLYIFILVIRIILVYTGANYFSPLVQFVVKFTNGLVKPMRRVLPNVGRFELATIVIILLLETLKFVLLILLLGRTPVASGLIFLVLGDTIKLIILTFFYAIILQAILSWVQPRSPINALLAQLTSPLIRPLQRVIPPVAGVDISPIPALIILQLLIILLVNPLMSAGFNAASF
ncbi:MAG: YggT family protein [Gammaproteobacteria bacterium]|nr:YggT family protein [Gammaproteobacteria bacterium]